MNNKKGFTLAELLGVIVILLLLVLIVTPIFINYTKKASNTAYDVQINTIKESAREWALDDANVKLLPTKDNECVKVSLEKLKEAGFLDFNITNPKTGEKFADESAVVIRKSGKKLTYTFDEDDNITCENVIAADYPRWVFVSSTPAVASDTDTVTVNIKSDRAISEESLQPENITVKVGSKIVDDANVVVACNGVNPLTCSLQISNLSGNGKLSLIIDKETMKDEDLNPSRITNIQTNTIVDTTGPIISYTGKENTNASIYYATKDDTVKIKFKAEDNGTITNNLQASDIIVYLDGTEITCTKDLTTTGSGSTINYELRLSNVEGNGKVTIKIPSGKIADNMGNLNGEKIISPGITFDNIKPTIEYDPSGSTAYLRDVDITITATDNETGINADSLKYIFTTDQNATPTTSIINGEKIHRENLNGDYYVIGYVCDYAGNCATVPSNVYRMNNQGPSISIVPDHNSGYATSATFKINVTSNGEALDEGSFKYIVATSKSAAVNKSFTNNTNITMDNLTGTYYVVAEACDVSGLCTRKESDEFYLDNEAPAISLSPNGSSWSKSVSVAIGVSDNVNVDWAKYIVSTNKTATPETTISNNSATATVTSTNTTGTYYVITKACDGLGNCKQSASNPYYIDNTKPSIGTISVSPQASANPKTTRTSVTISDDIALARYEIYNSSGTRLVNEDKTGTSQNITYTQNARGTYTLKVYDHLGNMSSKDFTVPGYKAEFVVSNGTVSPTNKTVNYGETVSVTNTPSTGYHFASVSCTNSQTASNNNGTITTGQLTNNTKCTITNQINTYKVKFQISPSSYGSVANSEVTVNYNTTASTTFTINSGYKYKSVTSGCSVSNNTVSVSGVKADKTCVITLEPENYYLDLNGLLDGSSSGSISNYGTADVYINGTRVADDVADYYAAHPYGSTYEIKDIKTSTGRIYNGNSSYSGTIPVGGKAVQLSYSSKKITVTFKPNGGSGSDKTQTFTYGAGTQSFSAKGFTKTHYSQGKWAESSTGSGVYDILSGVSDSWINSKYDANSSHTVTLYATWALIPTPAQYVYEPLINGNNATFSIIIDWTANVPPGCRYQYTLDNGVTWNNCTAVSGSCKVDLSLQNSASEIRIKSRYIDGAGATSEVSPEIWINPARLYIWQLWQGAAMYDMSHQTTQIGVYRVLNQNFDPDRYMNHGYNNRYINAYGRKMGNLAIGTYINSGYNMYFYCIGSTNAVDAVYRGILGRNAEPGNVWVGFINKNRLLEYASEDGTPSGNCVNQGFLYTLIGVAQSGEANGIYDKWGFNRGDRDATDVRNCVEYNNCSVYSSDRCWTGSIRPQWQTESCSFTPNT